MLVELRWESNKNAATELKQEDEGGKTKYAKGSARWFTSGFFSCFELFLTVTWHVIASQFLLVVNCKFLQIFFLNKTISRITW